MLRQHLATWLGAWPPGGPGVDVVGSQARIEPGWDGAVRPLNGVVTPHGSVVSVPPARVDAVRAALEEVDGDIDRLCAALPELLDRPGGVAGTGVFRWTTDPSPSDDPGTWLEPGDERMLPWLEPFDGGVLVAFEDGRPAAGVGIKAHDDFGHEVAVVTEPEFRGQGYASRLVSQACRAILERGAVPTYLHAPTNTASARTAERCNIPDVGWRILGLFGGTGGDD